MKHYKLAAILALVAGLLPTAPALAKNSDWTGVYTFYEESRDEERARTAYWFRLEIEESNGRLVGRYSDGVNGRAARRFETTVETNGKTARVLFGRALPRVEGVAERCAESEFTGGELLFEFEEATAGGRTVIYTIRHKLNLAARTETGSSGPRSVFFRKTSLMK